MGIFTCLHIYLPFVCVPGTLKVQQRMSDLLELNLQKVVSCHEDAEN